MIILVYSGSCVIDQLVGLMSWLIFILTWLIGHDCNLVHRIRNENVKVRN